ncbi:MAG: hypothetical protein KKA84_01435 [Bacteroidetes bacterium]|nr:hypothetical protein [Bacteroidota bacterium]
MKKKYLLSTIVLSLFLTAVVTNAGVKGKILTKAEAEKLFGPVTTSVTITSSALEEMLTKAQDNIMFMIRDGKLYTATSLDSVLTEGYVKGENDVFHVYSKSVAEALLNFMYKETTGAAEDGEVPEPVKDVYVEMREDVMTVSYGDYVMEFGSPCPPYCE